MFPFRKISITLSNYGVGEIRTRISRPRTVESNQVILQPLDNMQKLGRFKKLAINFIIYHIMHHLWKCELLQETFSCWHSQQGVSSAQHYCGLRNIMNPQDSRVGYLRLTNIGNGMWRIHQKEKRQVGSHIILTGQDSISHHMH